MPALQRKARDEILGMMSDEVQLLTAKANERAGAEWDQAEAELARREGMADTLAKAEHLREQIAAMQAELNQLLTAHPWRQEEPTDRQYMDAGIKPPYRDWEGKISERFFPEIFGHKLNTRWALEVFKILDTRMNIMRVQQLIGQVAHAVRRDLLLAGNYEDARVAYNQFYQLLRRAGGDEVPPLLREITEMPVLLPPPNA